VCLALATTAACVVDIGAPNRVPRISIISDISRTDTINAGPSKPIVIEISDSTCSLQNAVAVNITGTPTPTPEGDFGMFVMDQNGGPGGAANLMSSGKTTFQVFFGRRGLRYMVYEPNEGPGAGTLIF
jgi:hypothetical protein